MEANIQTCLLPIWYTTQIFLLWILADFITGMIHWWEDTYGNPNWPIIGKYIVVPNLDHHRNPRSLLKGTYWNRINTSFYAASVVAVILWMCGYNSWQLDLCLFFSCQGNEIHAIAHRSDKENGKFIKILQKLGIIQSRHSHGWHHRAPYETNFCVMTEFLNPILNRIHFWERIEFIILKVFKIKVLRGSSIRDGI